MDVKDPPQPPGAADAVYDLGLTAFKETLEDQVAVDAATAPVLTLDVPTALLEAARIWQRIQKYTPQIEALPVDLRKIHRFMTYAHALSYVHSRLSGHAGPERAMPVLFAEAKEDLRPRLRKFVELLVLSGDLHVDVLKNLRPGSGHADVVADLGTLVVLLQGRPDLLGRPVTAEVVARAAAVHYAMTQAAGADGEPDLTEDELRVALRKLGVLLLGSWNEIRRAMNFIRFYEKDAASICKSLYSGGRPKGAGQGAPSAEERLATAHDGFHADDEEEHAEAHAPPTGQADPEFNPFEPSEPDEKE